jgi:hypothetical protein
MQFPIIKVALGAFLAATVASDTDAGVFCNPGRCRPRRFASETTTRCLSRETNTCSDARTCCGSDSAQSTMKCYTVMTTEAMGDGDEIRRLQGLRWDMIQIKKQLGMELLPDEKAMVESNRP